MEYLLLYANCILVEGAVRATICDLQKGDVYPIPKGLADQFIASRMINMQHLKKKVEGGELEALMKAILFLQEHQLAFYCEHSELKHFPGLNTEWLFPAHISHCILDTANGRFNYFTESFLKQLSALCCNFIQFRLFASPTIDHLNSILTLINNSQVKSFEILLPWNEEHYNGRIYERLVEDNKKISSIVCWAAPSDDILMHGSNGMGYIFGTRSRIDSASHCGIIDEGLFSVSMSTYTESLHYNSCLNRKISVDINGDIKNCPSMTQSFGNIRDTTLAEAMDKPGFKKYWNITKDQISVCKDCEFRYICTDCRAYLENPEDVYSKPLKCGYNPYTCEWEDWSISAIKQQAIRHYDFD